MNDETTNLSIDGYDPLGDSLEKHDSSIKHIMDAASKRIVSNILKCYTGYFDVFSEIIQNSLDAIESKLIIDNSVLPKVWINIDIKNSKIRIVDNGLGMSFDEF